MIGLIAFLCHHIQELCIFKNGPLFGPPCIAYRYCVYVCAYMRKQTGDTCFSRTCTQYRYAIHARTCKHRINVRQCGLFLRFCPQDVDYKAKTSVGSLRRKYSVINSSDFIFSLTVSVSGVSYTIHRVSIKNVPTYLLFCVSVAITLPQIVRFR